MKHLVKDWLTVKLKGLQRDLEKRLVKLTLKH